MKSKAPTLFLSTSLLVAASASAAIPLDWTTTHRVGLVHQPVSMVAAADGSSFLLATVEFVPGDSDLVLSKFDATGVLLWERTYAGPGGQDLAVKAIMSSDGLAAYAIGRSSVPNQSSNYTVLKYDAATGSPLWARSHNGPSGSTDDPRDAAATPDGGVVVTGGVWNGSQRLDYGTVKYAADGSVAWVANYSGPGRFMFNDDAAGRIAVTAEGDIVVAGFASSATGGSDVRTLKYHGSTGAVLWSALYSTSANESVRDLAIAPDGDAIVLGLDPFGVDAQWLLARYDGATGVQEWAAVHDPGNDETPSAVTLDALGNVYAVGATDPDFDDSNFNEDLVVIGVDAASGLAFWTTKVGGLGLNQADFGHDIAWQNGRLWIAGTSRSDPFTPGALDANAVVLELDPFSGSVLDFVAVNSTIPDGPVRNDAFTAMAFDSFGNMLAAGSSSGDVGVPTQALLARLAIGTTPACVADLDDGSGAGIADGAVDINDLLYFLVAFEAGSASVDLDNGTSTGTPDEAVDINDLLFFLARFEVGC